ncbi:hypothetical protein [Maritimibacter harenae]|nr:hypothetical protein [Maritimibacter harenae]
MEKLQATMPRAIARPFAVSVFLAFAASLAIFALGPALSHVEFPPDQGYNWYLWKRPDPDVLSRATAWGGYLAHQVFLWGLIWWAQQNRDRLRDRTTMHPLNWVALGGTAVFAALHAAQTALFYDGLAQDVPVMYSQGSVVLVLVIILLMEAPRRGLFFGVGKGWFAATRPLLVRTHGYYFAWAVTFTYWYHPMETTWGHVLGFLYTFLLFIQASFIFTRVHTNRWWTFALEGTVLIHGVIVALVAGQDFWPMFAFGFAALVVITQMHGLGLTRATRWIIGVAVVGATLAVYSERGWTRLEEVARIPLIDYVLVAVIAGLLLLVKRRFHL